MPGKGIVDAVGFCIPMRPVGTLTAVLQTADLLFHFYLGLKRFLDVFSGTLRRGC